MSAASLAAKLAAKLAELTAVKNLPFRANGALDVSKLTPQQIKALDQLGRADDSLVFRATPEEGLKPSKRSYDGLFAGRTASGVLPYSIGTNMQGGTAPSLHLMKLDKPRSAFTAFSLRKPTHHMFEDPNEIMRQLEWSIRQGQSPLEIYERSRADGAGLSKADIAAALANRGLRFTSNPNMMDAQLKGEIGLFDPYIDGGTPARRLIGPDLEPVPIEYASGGSVTNDNEDLGELAVRRAGMEHKGDFKPAANLLTQLARGWLAGTAGLPGDLEGLARTVNKYTSFNPAVRAQDSTPVLPTSEFYKEWLPGEDKGVGGKELNDLASLFGGAGSTTLARGGVKAGKGALTLADVAARNAAVPRTLSTQAGVIKAPGGNWLSGSVEDALKGLKRPEGNMARQMEAVHGQRVAPIPEADQADALNNWIDKQLTRYVKNDMATERDPIRALAERGVSHSRIMNTPYSEMADVRAAREAAGLPDNGLAESLDAQLWEKASDSMTQTLTAAKLKQVPRQLGANPWLLNVPPETLAHRLDSSAPSSLGFDHLMDELRNATNPASGLPRELQLDPKSLDRLSVPQAVERVAKINQWREAQKIEASQALANNPATHLFKEYPHSDAMPNPKGLRWVELKTPSKPTMVKGEYVDPSFDIPQAQQDLFHVQATREAAARGFDPDGDEFMDAVIERTQDLSHDWATKNKPEFSKELQDALKYEGDTMGHCVGGYCDDVASGKSRIYSLRDAKGQPHVTVEVEPGRLGPVDQYDPIAEKFWDTYGRDPRSHAELEAFAAPPPRILQIKGKGNKKPNDEYLPFVHDFVKSGKWSDVGDLQNTGLYDTANGLADFTPTSFQADRDMRTLAIGRAKAAGALPKYVTRDEWEAILKQYLPTPDERTPKFASGGSVLSNPYTIDAAAFHTAVDPLLSDVSSWQAHDDSPQKLALQLGNGATWNVGGGEGTYGSGVYRYDPWTEADDKRYQEALAAYNSFGGAEGSAMHNPDNIAVGSGGKSDRDNMLASWKAKEVGGYGPNATLYRVRGDMSGLLGKPDSRMFLDAGYQEHDGQMVPIGTPSRTYQKSAGAENISMLSALLAPYAVGTALAAQQAAAGGAAMAEAASAANAANAAQGFGNLGVAATAPAAGLGEQAIAAYQAAQPYIRAVNTVGSLASGNPMGAVAGYIPGVDLGLGDLGNAAANGAVRAAVGGGDPLMGAVTGAAGNVIPGDMKQYLPMANALMSAANGKLSLPQALQLASTYTKQNKG